MFSNQLNDFCLEANPSIFDEAWNLTWHLKFKFLARNGYEELSCYTKHLKATIGNLKLEKITPLLLEQFRVKYLNAGMKSQTITHILGLIRRVFNYIIQLNLYHGPNPASKIKMPKEDNSRHRFLTKEEAHLLLDTLKEKSLQVWQISLLSLSTGMRAGEIFNLRGEHVSLQGKTIRIVDPKNGKNRTVYLPNPAIKIFKDCQLKMGQYVFAQTSGKRLRQISDTFPRTVDALGLNEGLTDPRDKIVFHSLRHTFASWMVQNDQPLYVLAEMLGHSTLEMTKRYAHLSPQRQRAAITILDDFL